MFACSSCRNAMVSSSGMSTPLIEMLVGSTGVVVLLKGIDMVAREGGEFLGR